MFPAVLETKIETDSELEKTLNRKFLLYLDMTDK